MTDKPKPKTHSLRFTPAQWTAAQVEADRMGYSGPNALFAAILDGDIPIGAKIPGANTYADRMSTLEHRLATIEDELEQHRRHLGGLPLLTHVDLP